MGISKYNSEGYSDPTSHVALSGIRKEERAARRAYRPLVYICSPFAGDTEGNTEKARRYCRFAVKNGAIPLAPHLLFPQFLDDGKSAERAIGMFMRMVRTAGGTQRTAYTPTGASLTMRMTAWKWQRSTMCARNSKTAAGAGITSSPAMWT